jgi:two-component system chemotaxis response regulator CheB
VAAKRILVADSSLWVCRLLREAFSRVPGFLVVGEASHGERALEMCQRLRPDVVVLDLQLEGLSGLEATARIMAECPTRIVLLCAAEQRAEGQMALNALAAGAAAVVDKPTPQGSSGWVEGLVARVRLAARLPVPLPRAPLAVVPEPVSPAQPRPYRVVAIGASMGGPQAVREVLRGLPRDFHLPVLLVLHLSERFDSSMAEWLTAQTGVPVRHALDGEVLPSAGERPRVWMAPAGHHLVVRDGRLRLEDGPKRHSCRPSVDVLFESLAREVGPGVVACLLTGMGTDGAEGLAALRRAGAPTLAQDEATSAMFGMPQEAIRLGAASYVVPLPDIAPLLAGHAVLARPRPARRTA